MQKSKLVDFGQIDQTGDPSYFIQFLDEACAQESFQSYKRRTYEMLEIEEGDRLLEVGCGTGDDARVLAKLVGPKGHIVGLDNSAAMIAEAKRRAEGLGLPIDFQVGDAMKMTYADNSFDACRADRSFMHIPDPRAALREMARVTKPKGQVLVYEVDFETLVIDAPDRPLARHVIHAWCDGFRNGWLGRHIPALYREVGLAEATVIPATLMLTYNITMLMVGPPTVNRALATGSISADEGKAWLAFLAEANAKGDLLSTLSGFIVCAAKR